MSKYEYIFNLINQVWYETLSKENVEKYGIVEIVHSEETDNNVLISFFENEIYIVFRGTENNKNIISHFNAFPRVELLSNIKVHKGWYEDYKSLQTKLLTFLKTSHYITNGIKKINLVGHSLGASLAGICAIDLISKGFKIESLFLVALPKFTNQKGIKYIQQHVPGIEVYLNGDDYIWWVAPFMKRLPFIRIGIHKWWKIFSFNDHLPWNTKNSIGYVEAFKKFKNIEFKNPW